MIGITSLSCHSEGKDELLQLYQILNCLNIRVPMQDGRSVFGVVAGAHLQTTEFKTVVEMREKLQ